MKNLGCPHADTTRVRSAFHPKDLPWYYRCAVVESAHSRGAATGSATGRQESTVQLQVNHTNGGTNEKRKSCSLVPILARFFPSSAFYSLPGMKEQGSVGLCTGSGFLKVLENRTTSLSTTIFKSKSLVNTSPWSWFSTRRQLLSQGSCSTVSLVIWSYRDSATRKRRGKESLSYTMIFSLHHSPLIVHAHHILHKVSSNRQTN